MARKGEAVVSSCDAGLEDIFEGEEVGERKVMTELVGRSKPESKKRWKSSTGSEMIERKSSQ